MSENSDDSPRDDGTEPGADASDKSASESSSETASSGKTGTGEPAGAEAASTQAAPSKTSTGKTVGAKGSKASSGKTSSGKTASGKTSAGRTAGGKTSAGKGTARRSDARRASGGRDRVEEFESVLSGRLVLATALCLAMVLIPLSPLGRLISKKAPESAARTEWKVGTKGRVHVTLITADYDKLDCADTRKVGDFHCAFEDEKKPFPKAADAPYDDNKRTILQPYRTTDGQLLFLAGLWAQPEIAMRLHREPARNVPEKKLVRFVAECEVDFLEEWPDAKFRWAPRDAFGKGETAMVARPIECHVFEGP